MIKIFNFFRAEKSEDKKLRKFLSYLFGFTPHNLYYYREAFRHRSSLEENSQKISNERLEFLGDSVIELAVREFLFRNFPDKNEGSLTAIRVKIVNREFLGKLARKLELYQYLEVERGSKKRLLQESYALHGNLLEALMGAVFIDKGYEKSREIFMEKFLNQHIDMDELIQQTVDYKSRLMEWSQKYSRKIYFKVLKESDGEGSFEVALYIDNQKVSTGVGRRKKKAENQAARKAWENGAFIDE